MLAPMLAAVMAAAPAPPVIAVPSPPPVVLVPVHPSHPAIQAPRPPAPTVVRPPQPRRPAQDYVTPDDYTAAALAGRHEGWVAFILDVGPNGRVHGCRITRSSGVSILDSVTCAIMVRRARFTPAIDSNGQPAAGSIAQEIEWRLPGGAERG